MTFQKPRLLTEAELNTIRGKCLVAAATPEELMQAFGHYDTIEMALDKSYGEEKWRKKCGIPYGD